MHTILALITPIILFIVQYWISLESGLDKVSGYYATFLFGYIVSFVIGYFFLAHNVCTEPRLGLKKIARYFLVLKTITCVYFLLIFVAYFAQNGYADVRGYMTSDQIKSSPFYTSALMYVDSYILVPLNYLFLVYFITIKDYKKAVYLVFLLFLQYVVFFAGRGFFYNIPILIFFYLLHSRVLSFRVVIKFMFLAVFGLVLSIVLHLNRDSVLEKEGAQGAEIEYSLVYGVVYYHTVPPLIFNNLVESSKIFRDTTGYGLATFGFLTDLVAAILPVENTKEYMPSKLLSAEAQNLIFNVEGADFNAFATFLFPAVYDFGVVGPLIYGMFFGFFIGRAYKQQNSRGKLMYVILAFYVYFNSFTFFITGEWFWVLLICSIYFRSCPRGRTPEAKHSISPGFFA